MSGIDNLLEAPVIGGINQDGQGGNAPEIIEDDQSGQGGGGIESEQRQVQEAGEKGAEHTPDEHAQANAEEDARWKKIEAYVAKHGEEGLEKLIEGAQHAQRKITEQGQQNSQLRTENVELRAELDRINSGLQSLPPAPAKTAPPVLSQEAQYDNDAVLEWQRQITEHATNSALAAMTRAQAEYQYVRDSVAALDGQGDDIGLSDNMLVESIEKQTGRDFDEEVGEEMKRALRADQNYQTALRGITFKVLEDHKADGIAQWMYEQKLKLYKSIAYDKLMRSGDGEALKAKREERINQLKKNAASGVKGGAGGGGTKYGGGAGAGKSGSQIDSFMNFVAGKKR